MRLLFVALLSLSSALNADRSAPFIGAWHSKDLVNSTVEIRENDNVSWVGKCISSDSEKNVGKTMIDISEYDKERKEFKGVLTVYSWHTAVDFVAKMETKDRMKFIIKKFLISKEFIFNRIQPKD